MQIEAQSITEVARALRARAITAEAVTERCLQQIADHNPSINAFITVLADRALAQARAADRELAAGRDRGPLHGIPISVKDIFDVEGTPTTAASRVRDGHIAGRDATSIARLRQAGAVFVGKTNLHEFALGTTNEDSAYGPVRHPLDPSRSPGGSSGGSAASLLAGMACASIGSDTGGSIRIPSAACGLVGLKPAYGEIPTDGVVPLSTTMDHVGPICRSVEDAAIVYEVLRLDAKAEAPALQPIPPRAARGMRVGLLRGYFTALLDSQVASTFEAAYQRLHSAGVMLDEVVIRHASDTPAIYVHISLPEAAAYHAHTLDSRPEDYTTNVRLRLEMGRSIMAEDYVRAMRGRDVLRREVDEALAGCDALLLPAMAVPATRLGADTVRVGGTEEPVRSVTLRLTQLFNVTGHPAISMPCGKTFEGLPVGAQLVAARTPELLAVARTLEPYFGPGTGISG
jgi:aspartyl-tRNA(Asn)/glutamyl-tRNA(Gln) amidotransferase subunit A